jgi:hypothetical protein
MSPDAEAEARFNDSPYACPHYDNVFSDVDAAATFY